MIVFYIIGIIYITIGFIYAVYIAASTSQPIWYFPINLVFGPPVLIYILINSIRGKRLPVDTPNV